MLIKKQIPGFPGYFAGSDGCIRRGNSKLKASWSDDAPHKRVWLRRGRWRYCKYIHRLVAIAFELKNPRPDIFNIVDHIDMNEINNRPCNLRWVTHQLNTLNNSAMGCSFDKTKKLWHARVRVDDILHSLGFYKTFLEAHLTSKAFRKKSFERIYKDHCDAAPYRIPPQKRAHTFVQFRPQLAPRIMVDCPRNKRACPA